MPYQLDNRPPDLREQMYFPEIIRGIGTITAHFFRNLFFSRSSDPDILARKRGLGYSDNVTLQYPEEKQPYPPGYRGLHRLVPREDGKPRCVACYMCATACPAQCIYIEAAEYPDDPVEKYPAVFVIDELRCVVCGFCVEACPKDAIRMDTGEHAAPTYTREAQVLDLPKLLRGEPVSYQADPWLKRESPSIPADKLAEMKAAARPFPSVATDEYAQTPGFSVRALAAEARERAERARR
ncbi:MAG TPA: NADH-quinone oxidoreductase subunit I [Anaeromyxobacteraceae bacterium]|nr:NADH-quinone oxidoreductase subunit I [Anaeromyxobacteraceae bacterium]